MSTFLLRNKKRMVGEIINTPETNKTLSKNEAFELDQKMLIKLQLILKKIWNY